MAHHTYQICLLFLFITKGTILLFSPMSLCPGQLSPHNTMLCVLRKCIVVFSVCARMGNAAYIIFIMWNSIDGLDAWYHFLFNISCGVAVTVSHQKSFR